MKTFIWLVLLTLGGLTPAWVNATPDSRYVIKGDEVYDKNANLTWQRCSVGQHWKEGAGCTGTIKVFTFEQVQHQANDKWRVPTQDELASLIDHSREEFPTIDTEAFPGMDQNTPTYWSSTPSSDGRAWDARFNSGDISDDVAGYRFAVRLVREGQ